MSRTYVYNISVNEIRYSNSLNSQLNKKVKSTCVMVKITSWNKKILFNNTLGEVFFINFYLVFVCMYLDVYMSSVGVVTYLLLSKNLYLFIEQRDLKKLEKGEVGEKAMAHLL